MIHHLGFQEDKDGGLMSVDKSIALSFEARAIGASIVPDDDIHGVSRIGGWLSIGLLPLS